MTQVTKTLNLNELLNTDEFFVLNNETNLVATVGKETIDVNLIELISAVSFFGGHIHGLDFEFKDKVPSISYAKMKNRVGLKLSGLGVTLDEKLQNELVNNVYLIKCNDIDIFFIWLNKYRYVAFEVQETADDTLKVQVHTNIDKAIPPKITRLKTLADSCKGVVALGEAIKPNNFPTNKAPRFFVQDWKIEPGEPVLFYKQVHNSQCIVDLHLIPQFSNKNWLCVEVIRKKDEFVLVHKNGSKFHIQEANSYYKNLEARIIFMELTDLTWLKDIKELEVVNGVPAQPEIEEPADVKKEARAETNIQLTDLSSLREHLKGMERLVDKLHNDPLSIDDLKALDQLDRLCFNLSCEVMDIQRRIEYMKDFEDDRRDRVSNSRDDEDWSREGRGRLDWRDRSRRASRHRRRSNDRGRD